jgi:hypothetical protein
MILKAELRSIQEYQSVLQAIHGGSTKFSQIDSKSKINDTAKTSKYVKKLIDLEIIDKEYKFLEDPIQKIISIVSVIILSRFIITSYGKIKRLGS